MFRSFGRNWFEYGLERQSYKLGRNSLSGTETKYYYRNDGGTFTNVAWTNGTASRKDGRGTAIADYDRDGDLDIVMMNNNQALEYFENQPAVPGHWLVVQLRGTDSNSHGIGARLTLTAGGKQQVREATAGCGFLGTPPAEQHFGLGAATAIERLEVRWPTGKVQVLEGLAADQVIVVEESGSYRPLQR